MVVQYHCHVSPSVSRDNDTALPLVEVFQASQGYRRFQIGCVFAGMICLKFSCMSFDIILTQFYVNFSRQEHHIELL